MRKRKGSLMKNDQAFYRIDLRFAPKPGFRDLHEMADRIAEVFDLINKGGNYGGLFVGERRFDWSLATDPSTGKPDPKNLIIIERRDTRDEQGTMEAGN